MPNKRYASENYPHSQPLLDQEKSGRTVQEQASEERESVLDSTKEANQAAKLAMARELIDKGISRASACRILNIRDLSTGRKWGKYQGTPSTS